MATLQFPTGISQCLLSMGIAYTEPRWHFSVTAGKVALNLEWDGTNTGTLLPGPPPEIHKQYFYPSMKNSRPVDNSARYIPPRMRKSRYSHSSDIDNDWRSNSPATNMQKGNSTTCKSQDTAIVSENHSQKAELGVHNDNSSDLSYNRASAVNKCKNVPSSSFDSDTVNKEKPIASLQSDIVVQSADYNITTSMHNDLSDSEHDTDDSKSDNDSHVSYDSDIDSISSNTGTLCKSDSECGNLSDNHVQLEHNKEEPNDISLCETGSPISVCTLSEQKTVSYDPEPAVELLLITDNHVISISGCDSHVDGAMNSDLNVDNVSKVTGTNSSEFHEGEIHKGEYHEINEPRILSKEESRESVTAWELEITKYLCSDDAFGPIIHRGWQKSSVRFRGLDNETELIILDALIAQVVRYSNGAILGYQTKSCKSLKSLLNNVYRYHNIPLN